MDERHSIEFPVHATIAGVAVVTIPISEYADLLEKKARLVRLDKADRYAVPSRSPIEKDKTVRDFFMERLGKVAMVQIISDCKEHFGKARTPSKSAAYAFWKRLRGRSLE